MKKRMKKEEAGRSRKKQEEEEEEEGGEEEEEQNLAGRENDKIKKTKRVEEFKNKEKKDKHHNTQDVTV